MSKNWLRVLGGILSGGLSEIPIAAYNKAKNSADSPTSHVEDIERMIEESGLSEDEFFQIHPEYYEDYLHAKQYGNSFLDDLVTNAQENNIVSKTKDAYEGSKLEDNINKLVDNITGERDTQENQKNRDYQHEEADIARQWEAEQAKIAREWDSIGAQMERAAAVGVNPISIAMQNGGINGSLGTSIPSSPGIPAGSSGLMHSGALDVASMIFQGVGTLAENRLKQSQADDIAIMRQYNIAEKIANTDHLRKLCTGVDLSNTAQTIQNGWLDIMNQATYDGMLLENGVRRETIFEKRSIAKLNLKQIDSIDQSMLLALKEFNAKLPLELQLMESEIDFNRMSVQDLYSEICFRFLQSIEQESRNVQAANEAEQSGVELGIAKATYEDAISAFHNSMVKGAAEAGVSLYDYQYYGCRPNSIGNLPGSIVIGIDKRKQNKRGWKVKTEFPSSIQGLGD